MMAIVIVIAVVCGNIFIAFLVVNANKYNQDQLDTFANKLEVMELRSGKKYKGEYSGQEYQYQHIAGGRQSDSFHVSLACKSNGAFQITRETNSDARFKRLGISMEIQTGDKPFDETCYIRTDFDSFTQRFFQSTKKREALLSLFEFGFDSLLHDGETMIAIKNPLLISKNTDKLDLQAAVVELAILAKDPPEFHPNPLSTKVLVRKFKRIGTYLVSSVILIAGVILCIWAPTAFTALDKQALLYRSFMYSVPAFIIFVIAGAFVLKGRSSSHFDLKAIIAWSLFSFPLLGYGAMTALNGHLDKAKQIDYFVEIVDKRADESAKAPYHYVYLDSWRETGGRERFIVGKSEYDRLDIGKTLKVTTRPGKFGFEWVVDYKLAEPQ